MGSMNTIVIPNKIASKGEGFVVIPRNEYEALVSLKNYREFVPTKLQINALRRAEKSLMAPKTLSYEQFATKLGFAR